MADDTDYKSRANAHALDVVEWCRRLADDGSPLFSGELRPRVTIASIMTNSPAWPHLNATDVQRMRDVVGEVCRHRRQHLDASRSTSCTTIDTKRLVFYPNYADFIGLAAESGVVDEADVPAWDLWIATAVHEAQFCIVSYVPPWLREMADHAVSLSTTCDLVWCNADELSLDNHP